MMFDGTVMATDQGRAFFLGNQFYTTAVHRMTQGILPGASYRRILSLMQHKISAVLLFLLVPAAMIACILLQSLQTALLSTLVLLAALTPFFLAFERQKPRPRDFMPVVVLTALSVTGRLLFAALPNFKPVSAIVILAGVCFGRQSGFLTGALSALVSNLFFGRGLGRPGRCMHGALWGMLRARWRPPSCFGAPGPFCSMAFWPALAMAF